MPKYAWPLPGEGITAEELAIAEIRAALPGVNAYSGQARRDAMLAELVAALYNSSGVTFPGTLVTTDLRPARIGMALVTLASSGGSLVAPDFSAGTYFSITVNSTGAWTIGQPTNVYGIGAVQQFVIVEVHNASGGAITTTWNAFWHLAGAWTDPANGKSRFGVFLQLNAAMQEIARSAADT